MKLSHIVNLESIVDSNDGYDATSIDAPAEAQEVLTDLECDDREIGAADDAIDQASGAIDQIDETVHLVNEQEEAGVPLTDTQIQTLEITHESIMRSLGLASGAFPTVESLGSGNRAMKIVATMEATKGSIWEKLVLVIKQTVQQVSNFILGLVRNSWVLNKYKDYLKKKIDDLIPSAKPKQEEMEASAKAMSANGKASFESVGVFVHTSQEMLKGATAAAEKLAATNFKFGDVDYSIQFDKFITANKMPISGGREVSSNGWGSVVDNDIVALKQEAVASSAKVLSINEMKSALAAADKIIAALKAFDAVNGKVKRFASNIVQYLAHVGKEAAGVVSKDAKESAKEMSYIRGLRQVLSKVVGKLPLEAFKNAKVILDYVRNSLKQYDGAGKVEDMPASA